MANNNSKTSASAKPKTASVKKPRVSAAKVSATKPVKATRVATSKNPASSAVKTAKAGKPAAKKPKTPPKPQTLFDKIVEYGLERKLIGIACAEGNIPPGLRDETAQEIRMAWLKSKPNPEFTFGETASYAHRIAYHAALRAKRELGSVVRLPGSAFRKRRDGSTYVTPGVLAAAIDLTEIENRLSAEEEPVTYRRLDLATVKDKLNARQFSVLEQLASGASFLEVQAVLGIQRSALQRLVSSIKDTLGCNLPADALVNED